MRILLPMAGAGKRFQECGYDKPKPLIDVNGKAMIERVVENLGLENDYIFILQEEHYDQYAVQLENAWRNVNSRRLVFTNGLTQGAACTALLAEQYIDDFDPLMIANCDQIMEYNRQEFYDWFYTAEVEGAVFTFNSRSPKHSYVRLDEDGKYIVEVAEKQVISNIATVGVYCWRRGTDFVHAAGKMIKNNVRTNNEFYIAPSINQNLNDGAQFETYHIRRHHPIGTPEELIKYLNYKGI